MSTLLVLGNTREQTVANSILAADAMCRRHGGNGLSRVVLINSPEADQHLGCSVAWKDHLNLHNFDLSIIHAFSIDLSTGRPGVRGLVDGLRPYLLALNRDRDDLYVDLTNGQSLYKNVLSVVAYVLGARRQFVLKIDPSWSHDSFLSPEDAAACFVELPPPDIMDSLALLWRAEVRRFERWADKIQKIVECAGGTEGDAQLIASQYLDAIDGWLLGSIDGSVASLQSSQRSAGKTHEDVIRFLAKFVQAGSARVELGEVERRIAWSIARTGQPGVDPDLVRDLCGFLRALRNSSVHEVRNATVGGEELRARVALELLLVETDLFASEGGLRAIRDARGQGEPAKNSGGTLYCGIDGDDTGRALETMLARNANEDEFTEFAKTVQAGVANVMRRILRKPIEGTVLLSAGDDILFRGRCEEEWLKELQRIYTRSTEGMTCSVGYGPTPKDAYLALKLAKAQPGKGAIVRVG